MLNVYDHKRLVAEGGACEPEISTMVADSKITAGVWGLYDETIVTGHDNGMVAKYNVKVIFAQGLGLCCSLLLWEQTCWQARKDKQPQILRRR